MPAGKNINRRALGVLTESSGRESAISAAILIIRALLPLAAVFLIRYFIDQVTGVQVIGGGEVSGVGAGGPGNPGGVGMEAYSPPVTDGGTIAGAVTTLSGLAGESIFSIPAGLILLIGAMALALLADDQLSFAGNYINRKQSFLLEGHISSLIHAHSSRLGLKYFEDPLFHDRLERAASDISWRPAAMVSDLVLLLRGAVSFIAMGYILRNFGLLPLTILVAVFIPVLLVRRRNSSRLYETKKMITPDRRQASYFSWLLTGEKPAREVKLFGLGGYFGRLFRKHYVASGEPELHTVRNNIFPESIASLLKVAAFAGVLIYATSEFLRSSITAGELAMYLVAFRQALVYLRDSVTGYSGLAENRLFLQDLFSFLDLEPDMKGEVESPDQDSFSEIAAEKLTFTYPGAARPALQDINLQIKKGEKIAVVGPNGSGKTTLVKLLCRLYDPDLGRITVNGKDVATLEPASYRRLFSVVFQNFMLYYLSAGDNIRLGSETEPPGEGLYGTFSFKVGNMASVIPSSPDQKIPSGGSAPTGGEILSVSSVSHDKLVSSGRSLSRNGEALSGGSLSSNGEALSGDDISEGGGIPPGVSAGPGGDDEVRKAAAAVGIAELLESLPEGYDTRLGHHTEGSRELSWGEWQKIAIARAIYRRSPVLILDEPSSSLDADSEYEIFSDLSRITGDRTCIFISHRLSNVRDADRIIVLDQGRIAEAGTHDELMASGGKYYSMFTRQKSMYR